MGYILYTPTATEDTFSLKKFDSLAELAKWAVAQALEAPTPAPVATIAPAVTALAPAVTTLAPSLIVSETPLQVCLLPTVDVSAAEMKIDMRTWFDEDSESPWKAILPKKEWNSAAQEFMKILEKCYIHSRQVEDTEVAQAMRAIPLAVIEILYELCKKEPVRVIERLGGCIEVQWDKLPAEFWSECDKEFKEKIIKWWTSPKVASNPFMKDIETIYGFFYNTTINKSWKKSAIEVDGIVWDDTQALVLYLIGEWVSGRPASDAIMQFFIKLVVTGRYMQLDDPDRTVGASEFMDEYQRMVSGLTGHLSGEFVGWATKRVQHRHCKAALGELGVRQVRRSEGQRYIGLRWLGEVEMNYNRVFPSSNTLDAYEDGDLAPVDFEYIPHKGYKPPTLSQAPSYTPLPMQN